MNHEDEQQRTNALEPRCLQPGEIEPERANNLNAIVSAPAYDGSGNVEAYFSKQACENCGAHLAGDRYDITYRETLEGDILEASVCQDCFVSLCS
jgi:hypothetical protein